MVLGDVRAAADGVGFFIVPLLPQEVPLTGVPLSNQFFPKTCPWRPRRCLAGTLARLCADSSLSSKAPHRIFPKHLSPTDMLPASRARIGHTLPFPVFHSATERL